MNRKSKLIIAVVFIMMLIACDKPENADETAPTVTITSPVTGATVEDSVLIQVDAIDDDSVEKVEIWIDSVLVNTDIESPWEYSWDTDAYPDGSQHSLQAKAYDPTGNIGLSELVIVTTIEVITVTDIDGNVYETVQIGDMIWMAENLRMTRYRDGTAIPNVTDNTEWGALTTGAYCYYDNDDSNRITYGALYNWYAVTDTHNIAPEGWHVPTDAEWKVLEMFLGMSQSEADGTGFRGTNEGSKLAGNAELWNNGLLEINSEFGTSGFSALPGGIREGQGTDLGLLGYFWSPPEHDGVDAWSRFLGCDYTAIYRGGSYKSSGLSVRCVKD